MDDKEIGRIWAIYYPRSGNNRDALQICRLLCRLIREKSRFVFVIGRAGKLQRVLDACDILKGDFDEVENDASLKRLARGSGISMMTRCMTAVDKNGSRLSMEIDVVGKPT